MNSRLLYDARETDAKTLEMIEGELSWEDLELASRVREHIKNMHSRNVPGYPDSLGMEVMEIMR